MIRRLFLLIIFSFSAILYSQSTNPGIAGKKFILKLNVINGVRPLYLGGEIEYAVHRNVSVCAGGGYLTSEYNQAYYAQYDGSPSSSWNDYYWAQRITKGGNFINSWNVYGQVKYFVPINGIMPAPNGLYITAKAGGGTADIESKTGFKRFMPLGSSPVSSWSVKGIPYGYGELGAGYQKVIAKRFVIDAGANFNFTLFNVSGTSDSKDYTSTLANEFGPNTLWLFPTFDNGKPDWTGAKKQTVPVFNMGLSLYFKIGLLLF